MYETIFREVSLAHLLTLVDIPMLEQILSYERSASKSSVCKTLGFSNCAVETLSLRNSRESDAHS